MSTHIFILYDGIKNSVFASQVLQPLLNQNGTYEKKVLISFESQSIDLKKYIPDDYDIEVIILKKIKFFGKISLYYATHQLKRVLSKYKNYTLTARGPLAGFIFLHSTNNIPSVTIQVRGLLAQEYLYAKKDIRNPLLKMIHRFRAWQMYTIEKNVFVTNKKNVSFQTVTHALKTYLIDTFKTPKQHISIAHHDIPAPIAPKQLHTWKMAIRTELRIPHDVHVYCYNGSAKPWQCPEKVVSFFAKEHKKNQNSFLLLLTQGQKIFTRLLKDKNIPPTAYTIKTVPHTDIYKYLSACDTGLLFREKHLINWVSRPTKVLEYQAVGLNIIHNNTVAMLSPFDTFCSFHSQNTQG